MKKRADGSPHLGSIAWSFPLRSSLRLSWKFPHSMCTSYHTEWKWGLQGTQISDCPMRANGSKANIEFISVFLAYSKERVWQSRQETLLSTYSVLGTSPPPRNRVGLHSSPFEELRVYSGHECISITVMHNVSRGYVQHDREHSSVILVV